MIRNAVTDWMWKKKISHGDIVMATQAPKSTVSMTIKGDRNDKRVLDYLRLKGCPDIVIQTRKLTIVRRSA